MAQGGGYDFRPIITHYLFLVTFLLAFAGWLTAFIGQAATTAQFANVGTLWFAIFLELFLILGVMHTLATDTISLHRLQISVFGAVAIVFSVNGANAGIYSAASAPQAMGAGWLILSFVNIIWVLYFTAEEGSTVLNTFDSLGSGSGLTPAGAPGGGRQRGHKHNQSITRSSNGYAGAGKEEHMGMSGITPVHTGGPGGMRQNSPGGMTGAHSFGEDSQHRAASPSTPLMSNAVPPGSGAAGGVRPGNDPEQGAPTGGYAYRAKALYAYSASPDDPAEISFAKGEVLDIMDNNGKWWQARKEDGTTGIVPSNYLQLV
ncbi:Transmembrane osmosensor [Ceratobasidium sp. 423]|nr:Transmembrane osmosensor [Ceratobasidium sp. 423]